LKIDARAEKERKEALGICGTVSSVVCLSVARDESFPKVIDVLDAVEGRRPSGKEERNDVGIKGKVRRSCSNSNSIVVEMDHRSKNSGGKPTEPKKDL
jgi:hypothetical protein